MIVGCGGANHRPYFWRISILIPHLLRGRTLILALLFGTWPTPIPFLAVGVAGAGEQELEVVVGDGSMLAEGAIRLALGSQVEGTALLLQVGRRDVRRKEGWLTALLMGLLGCEDLGGEDLRLHAVVAEIPAHGGCGDATSPGCEEVLGVVRWQ